jgi:hypothetical protein
MRHKHPTEGLWAWWGALHRTYLRTYLVNMGLGKDVYRCHREERNKHSRFICCIVLTYMVRWIGVSIRAI